MYTETTISGIDLHWNYQKHFWFIYIKELLVQKYWHLISTKQLWSIRNIVSSKSRTVQYRVRRCPGQYRNVQDRVPRCPSQYRDVQVSRCGWLYYGWVVVVFRQYTQYVVVLWLGCRCLPSVNTICGRVMIGHWFLFIFSLFWPLLQIIWYPRCMKVRHPNDSSIISSGVTNYAMCVRVSNWGNCQCFHYTTFLDFLFIIWGVK
jgi:hypothetical protein